MSLISIYMAFPLFQFSGLKIVRIRAHRKDQLSAGNLPKASSQCNIETVTDKVRVTESMASGNNPLKV